MRRVKLSILLILFAVPGFSQTNTPCDASLWQHVYHDYRLHIIEKCKNVTGVVEFKRREKDGDWHIRLQLDSGQYGLLNEKNISEQHGCLVIELICACEVSQTDAVGSCEGFVNDVRVPEVGEHIRVTGSYVYDSQHGWNEIHPITKIVVLGAATTAPEVKIQTAPSKVVFSNNEAYMCSGKSEVYHTNPNCSGLSKCNHSIIKSTADSAVNYYHRRLCKICGK